MLANASEYFHLCKRHVVCGDANQAPMDGLLADAETMRALCRWAKLPPSAVANKAGVAVTTVTRPYNGAATTRTGSRTWEKLRLAFPGFPGWPGAEPDQITPPLAIDYVQVDVLPTYAGMGGGGTGEGDVEQALVPQYLVRDVFRGQPSDFVVIRVRGNSMEPRFFQDDELLVDKRDTSPTQPGPFALWDADWGEYLVKNVERLPGGRVRIFPSNTEFSASEVSSEETKILGRPVWVGRRL
jgi:hypothetical protein